VGVYLVLLSLLVAVPLIAASAIRLALRGREAVRQAERDTERLARLAAEQLDEQVRLTDALLLGLSAQLVPTAARRAQNDSVLRAVFSASDGSLVNIFLLDPEGTVVGTSLPLRAPLDTARAFADRPYLPLALQRRGAVVGGIARSAVRADSAWRVIVARAVRAPDGTPRGVVGASILADRLGTLPFGAARPTAPLVTVIDTSGTLVARSVDPDAFVGRHRFDMAEIPRDSTGVRRLAGLDGVERITGFAWTRLAPWVVAVEVHPDDALADWRRDLRGDLLILLVGVTVSAGVALGFGARFARPLGRLAEDARTFSRGLIGHRSRPEGPREVREVASAFNQMAETVERRSAALSDSERRYRLLFESNPLPMWAWDAETLRILAVNDAAIAHYGHARDAFLGLRITDLLDPAEQARFEAARLPFSEARQRAGTWRHRTADGRTVEMDVITTSSVRLGRPSWLSVGIDVTARRDAERALARSEEQLRQAQKMEAIGAFAGGIAHDFNNLLTGILGYCDLALGDLPPEAPGRADVAEVRGLALRGAELTRQILAVSRRQVVRPTTLDVNATLRELERLLRRVIGEHIALETRLDPRVAAIRADAGQFEQVVLNLAANARDAMPSGGTLHIATRVVPPGEAATAGLDPARGWIAVTVRDTGVGMTEAVRQRAFEPFFTTKERGKGTGLGLALAYAAVDQAGGRVTLESAPGAGTTVQLCFPAEGAAAPEPGDATMRDADTVAGTETVLLAEDEASVRAVSAAALERAGYTVLVAADGDAAATLADGYPAPIHLLVTDVVMPGRNGRELAEALRRQRPGLRTLFASGYTDDATLLAGIREDGTPFLQKPYSAEQLLRRVRAVLDGAPATAG
jgi:PAS domain S-box-containing protein